jgi:AcrR family transcriptional regulator
MTTILEPKHEPNKPGRPRSAQVHQAILEATLELLAEAGYQAMSIEQIATRAGVGKTTIYRRWPSKEVLVSDAIRSIQADMPVLDSGNLRDDLIAMYRMALKSIIDRPLIRPLYIKLAGEFYSNPSVFQEFFAQQILLRFNQFRQVVANAQARGEIRRDLNIEIVMDMLIGPVLFRWMAANMLHPSETTADLDPFLEQFADLVLACLSDPAA